jgi:hypothetical protein
MHREKEFSSKDLPYIQTFTAEIEQPRWRSGSCHAKTTPEKNTTPGKELCTMKMAAFQIENPSGLGQMK